LVYREKKASDVSAFSFNSEIGGLFGIVATALDPQDMDYIDQAIDEELEKFLAKGPTKEELFRIKNGSKAGLVRGLERIAGKADALAQNQVFRNDPNHYLKSIRRVDQAKAKDITRVANEWLSDGEYALRVLPYADYTTVETEIDRTAGIPTIGTPPIAEFDKLQRATLGNGLKVVLAKRSAIPVVRMRLLIDAGFAADQNIKPGTANLTMAMLDEGAGGMDALEISTRLAQMGSRIGSSASLDSSQIAMDTLKDNLADTLEIFSNLALKPDFPANELERLKGQQIAAIAQEKSSPFGLAYRLLPSILYGENHAYSAPFSGSGTEQAVNSMTVEDLKNYHQTWFKANNATLIVTGDITLEEIQPMLNKAFKDMPSGDVPVKSIDSIEPISEPVIYLVDRPDSEQSAILAAKMLPEYGFDGELPLQLMNEVLGASFNARINMNLREDKGWSYGARSSIRNTQSQRPFIVAAPVQSDKTAESMAEIHGELTGILSSKPAQPAELGRAQDKRTLTLPGRWEAASSVESDIASMVKYNLKDDYWDKYVKGLSEVTLEQVNQSAKTHITPDNMVWLVVGERSQIEQKIRDLNIAKVVVLDEEGKILE
jgi:zinc protease